VWFKEFVYNLIKVMRILERKDKNMIIMGLEGSGKKSVVRMGCGLLGIRMVRCDCC
jgi:ABC-type proline/glycine betaine transport system ATPase subunit